MEGTKILSWTGLQNYDSKLKEYINSLVYHEATDDEITTLFESADLPDVASALEFATDDEISSLF